MKVELIDGCFYNMMIDGEEFISLPIEKQKEVLKKLVDKADSPSIQGAIEEIVRGVGNWEDLGYCEQCGSYNESYTVEIDEDKSRG